MRIQHTTQNDMQLSTYKLFIYHLMFSEHGSTEVSKTSKSEIRVIFPKLRLIERNKIVS
jgi:hypothetical protein